MFEFITYSTFFTEVIILNYLDYKINKSFINPFAFLSIPFSIILILCVLFNSSYGFIPFRCEALWVWTIGLFFFWIPSILTFPQRPFCKQYLFVTEYSSAHNNIVDLIIWSSIIYMFVNLNNLSNIEFGSKELGEELAVGGIKGRMSNILLVACPYIACSKKYNKTVKIIIVLVIMSILLAIGSKTWIMYALLATFLSRSFIARIELNSTIYTSIGGLLIFCTYYFLNTNINNLTNFTEFISRHFYFYLTSGILPLGEYIHNEAYTMRGDFILPFFNIINIWIGNKGAAAHSSLWYTTDNIIGTQSNVFTFFGTLFGHSIIVFILYCIFFGWLSYYIFKRSLIERSVFYSIMNNYNLSVLFFGWYNCSYGILRIWEIFVISAIFHFVSFRCKFK